MYQPFNKCTAINNSCYQASESFVLLLPVVLPPGSTPPQGQMTSHAATLYTLGKSQLTEYYIMLEIKNA